MDVKKTVLCVASKVNKVKSYLMVAAITGLSVLFGSSAFAQTPSDITLTVPEINYASVASELMTALVPVVLAAIGIGLSIWVITLLYRLFRTMGR